MKSEDFKSTRLHITILNENQRHVLNNYILPELALELSAPVSRFAIERTTLYPEYLSLKGKRKGDTYHITFEIRKVKDKFYDK